MTEADDCPFDGEVPTAPERPRAAPPPKAESDLEHIINAAFESLSFKDYAKLRSGRDSFSRMKLAELQAAVPETDWHSIVAALREETAQASCCRWILRGLACAKAIRKVKTDLEIAAKASGRR